MRTIVAAALALAFANIAQAAEHLPRGSATDITNAEIETIVKKNAGAPVSDQQIRVLNINGEYNVGVGVVHRAKTEKQSVGGSEHSQITEIYHVISGTGTMLTGGTIENAKERDANVEAVKTLTGPSTEGSRILNGTTRKVGPGDVIIIPPNTPHTFTEITSPEIVYLVVRVDPHKVLPAGYVNK
ncbi:MAG TPA: AraC family ligand binding domain-containing protein [Micropepsaceae bacterium]|jgi:quercetin dioxygenase-like cupin family protein|nr:AraC family ligand binding domain-containing protein [Micropepsaceae bacterium]